MRQSDADLVSSPVVANCDMNRQRVCAGVNSYQREIGLDPIAWLTSRLETHESASWLDLCCGEANALVEAAAILPADRVNITGIDLVDFFNPKVSHHTNIRLVVGALLDARLEERFDLITCVHGLHYVGDKLAAIFKFSAMLSPAGLMVANLDTHDVFDRDGKTLSRQVNQMLRQAGSEYDTRKKVMHTAPGIVPFEFKYLGADDRMGPNYTNQETVGSYYDLPGHVT